MRYSVLAAVGLAMWLCIGCADDRVQGTAGNDSTLVGGPCSENDDCDQRLCEMGATFPDGLCTLSCGSDSNCPNGSWCAGLDTGWVCLVACATANDCRPDWSCEAASRPGDDDAETVAACIGSTAP